MKINNIYKIITFILIFGVLLMFLSRASKSEAKELEFDPSFDTILASINTILEQNEQYKNVDKIVKNIDYNTSSYTLNVFCNENNDRKILNDRNNRITRVKKIINLHRINFLNADFNLL